LKQNALLGLHTYDPLDFGLAFFRLIFKKPMNVSILFLDKLFQFLSKGIRFNALAAWLSGQRIRLRDRRPGFESRQGIRFSGKTAIYMPCLCVYLRNGGIGSQN
jgi:hypothetical protein